MKELNIRKMRHRMGRLDELVAEECELVISRRVQPIAQIF